MKKFFAARLLIVVCCGLGSVRADEGAVRALGELNGVALACQQPALVARAREAVIDAAPKERAIGELFEKATSDSYLARLQGGAACPDGRSLAEQMARAIADLQAAYPPAR